MFELIIDFSITYNCCQNIFYKSLEWHYCLDSVKMPLAPASGIHHLIKTILHLLPLPCHINPCFIFMLQDLSNWEKSNLWAATPSHQHANFPFHAGFLYTAKSSKCRSLSFHCRILLLLHSLFWLRHDRNQTVLKNERQNSVFLYITRVMIKIFIAVSIISVVILIAMVIV